MRRALFFLFFITILSFNLYPQDEVKTTKIEELSFSQADIRQALKVISEIFGITIVPDREVTGQITRYFRGTTLEQTLTLLLEPIGFSYEVINDIYFVRKKPLFDIDYKEESSLFTIKSRNATLQDILSKISESSNRTIHFKGDSEDRIMINVFDKNLMETVKILCESHNYEISSKNNVIYVEKKEEDIFIMDNQQNRRIRIEGTEDKITIVLNNQSSNDLLLALFQKYKKEISLLSKSTTRIPYLYVKDVSFDDLLDILFTFSNQAYTKANGKYFIYDSINKNKNHYTVTNSYKLKNLSYSIFSTLVPPQIIPQSSYKLDKNNNIVTLIGSPTEVENYIDIIKEIDESLSGLKLRLFSLNFINAKDVKKYLPAKYKQLDYSVVDDTNSFYVYVNDEDYEELKSLFSRIDIVSDGFSYRFKYLDPEVVLKSMLPDFIDKKKVVLNKNDSSLYFKVSKKTKEKLYEYFDKLDVGPPVIRYQLLIVEYIRNTDFIWDWGAGLKNVSNDEQFNAEGGVFNGNDTINANFDIPTAFGYSFSAYFTYQLTEKKAKIQMSTEVYGISGEKVTLTNTSTMQYKDYQEDEQGNKTPLYNSTTFGLNLEIVGRATSQEEVFIEVSARVSDQLPGKEAGEAPDTSEKTVKNSVRTITGKPIILGGLISNKENIKNNIFPGLGHIPIIGEAFKTHNNDYSKSEFVIYIIPFIQKSEDDIQNRRKELIKEIYERCIKG